MMHLLWTALTAITFAALAAPLAATAALFTLSSTFVTAYAFSAACGAPCSGITLLHSC